MTSSRFKLYVSLTVVLAHVATFFGVLLLRAAVIPQANLFDIMGPMIPLFGVFLIVIIKDTVRGREDLSVGNVQTPQMIMLTFIMLGSYCLAVVATLVMIVLQSLEPADLPKWLATIESAFGSALGLIIDDLFGGKSQGNARRSRASAG
jgi:hypothetical protein